MTDMQPQNTENLGRFEQAPAVPPVNGEQILGLPPVEKGIEKGAEQFEQTAEARAAVANATGAPIQTAPAPVVVVPSDTTPTQNVTSPLVAADEDVIEKEWVDRAKQIILETKDDPHQRSSKVNELHKDYLQKRYGKELGANP